MDYSIVAAYYHKLEGTSSRLEMTDILVDLIDTIPGELLKRTIYLTLGKLAPDYQGIEFGVAEKMVIKALAFTTGFREKEVLDIWHRKGDPGDAAEELLKNKKQRSLFSTPLTVERVFSTFQKLAAASGKGTQDIRIKYLAELLHDAEPLDGRYIVRTVVGKLRLGIADMTVIDALAVHYLREKKIKDLEQEMVENKQERGNERIELEMEAIEQGKEILEHEKDNMEQEKERNGQERGNEGMELEIEAIEQGKEILEHEKDSMEQETVENKQERGTENVKEEGDETGEREGAGGARQAEHGENQLEASGTAEPEITVAEKKEVRDAIESAYNIHPDIGFIAEKMQSGGLDEIRKVGMIPGIPIRVMLAERLSTPEGILEKMGGEAAFEHKYDGIRIQAHVAKDKVTLFTRRQENATSQFPDIVKALEEVRDGNEMIIEGECVPVDANTGEMLPFQMVSRRRGRKYDLESAVEEFPVVLFLFDILYLNGENLIRKAFPERRHDLESAVTATDKVRLSSLRILSDPEKVESFFLESLDAGCEGLLAKSIEPNSYYRAGARGWQWIKFKRDYRSELVDTLDLTVVGGFHGKGRRAGTYGALLMAAYDPEMDSFETVCKLGSGFDDAFLLEMNSMFTPIEQKSPRVKSEIKADVWFEPKRVFEVLAAEITLSPIHTCARGMLKEGAGIAVRFPRYTGIIREDKLPEDATSSKELMEMYRLQVKGGKASAGVPGSTGSGNPDPGK